MNKSNKAKSTISNKKNIAFYAAMAALPLLQYFIFYILVNFNSIVLSFQEYKVVDGIQKYGFLKNIFANYSGVIDSLLTNSDMITCFKNSATSYLCSLFIITPLALLFSYYIIKKYPCSKFYRVILFLPNIICSVIMVYIFQVFADNLYPDILVKIIGGKKNEYQLLANVETRYTSILIFSLFMSFGVNVLMYSGAMSGVSHDIMEAAEIDGCNDVNEFVHIILPSVYPTLTTFIVAGIAGFFTNQMYLYSLKGKDADSSIWTFGYYMYKETISNSSNPVNEVYPTLSAMGIVFTLIAAPISMLIKWAMEKFGPSEN